ncbi:MAG TPA: hypothetical protein VFP97_14730 [Chitinophagaceae bacterium]|nr:hypothetical protein [Chitinophagaceae bacterium]
MSNDFEKFIRKNRNDFDDASPSGRVWENIERSLPVKKPAKRFTITDIYKWSVAAAIFFIALTSVYFLFIRKYSHEDPSVNTGADKAVPYNINNMSMEFAAEFKEASQAIRYKQEELRSAIANDPDLYRKFQADLNALDSSYRVLRDQASQTVNPDVIFKAMIENLQLQSELLSRQLMIMQEIKTAKTSRNEKNI